MSMSEYNSVGAGVVGGGGGGWREEPRRMREGAQREAGHCGLRSMQGKDRGWQGRLLMGHRETRGPDPS